jgi:hypothetical protein
MIAKGLEGFGCKNSIILKYEQYIQMLDKKIEVW